MKKSLLFFSVMLLCIPEIYSQATFNTGAMEVDINQYGRIRLFTPDGTYQLERASILVGTGKDSVFDYTNDVNEHDPTVLVTNPLLSDFEIYGSYDNTYSYLPPDVIVKQNEYGWNNGAYVLVKFTVINNETTAINALIGLDIIPYLNETYGYDTVTYLPTQGVIRFHRGTDENMGMKLLSASLYSLYSFEWFDGYTTDSLYWGWMNKGTLQPQYVSTTADGPVCITSQSAVPLAPQQSFIVYYAISIGTDEATMLNNIAAAEQKYNTIILSDGDIKSPASGLALGQNVPNPFSNSTRITYQVPESGPVSLKVYNTLGAEVAELVNTTQDKGSYSVNFNSKDLNSGIYYYILRFNGQVRTQKMFLVK